MKMLVIVMAFLIAGCGVSYTLDQVDGLGSLATSNEQKQEDPNETVPPEPEEKVCVEKSHRFFLEREVGTQSFQVQSLERQEVVPFRGDISGKENYNYYSLSGHPIHGPKPEIKKFFMYLYEGSDGLSIQYIVNKDKTSVKDHHLSFRLRVEANDLKDNVLFMDEPASTDNVKIVDDERNREYYFRFYYSFNTDGTVVGPLEGESLKLKFVPGDTNDLEGSYFANGNGGLIPVGVEEKLDVVKETTCVRYE